MRTLLAAAFLAATSAAGSTAGLKAPHVARGTPYPAAREQLIQQGFDPVRIIFRSGGGGTVSPCGGSQDVVPCYPELMECGGHAWSCDWLYARRSDGALFRVITHNEGEGWGTGDISRVMEIAPPIMTYLEGYIIARPRPKDRRPSR